MTYLITGVIIGIILGLFLYLVKAVMGRVIASKHASTNQIECALCRDQPDEVITCRWLHGLATLSSGQIAFQPRGSFGFRWNGGAPFVIPVLSAPTVTGRRPSIRQAWYINPRLQIVVMKTATGPVELAATKRSIQQLSSKVGQAAH